MPHKRHFILWSLLLVSALALTANAAPFDDYVQTNLVSSVSGLAETTDSSLINPWGVLGNRVKSALGFRSGNRGCDLLHYTQRNSRDRDWKVDLHEWRLTDR